MIWTKDKIATLVNLAALGYSFSRAANELGCTKGAIAGASRRYRVRFGQRKQEQQHARPVGPKQPQL